MEVWNEILDETIQQVKAGVTELQDEENDNGYDASNITMSTGSLRAIQFSSLQPGDFIDSFDLGVVVAAGNVRVKIYSDVSNTPDILLGESDSIPVSATGNVNFRLRKQVEIPQDGIVWCAFENDNAALDIETSGGQPAGTRQTVTHTYGDGPDPFGSATPGSTGIHMILHTKPKIVKHWGMRGSQPEDYFCIVSSGNMTTANYTNKGSINNFEVWIDISYRGVDYRDGLTKTLKVASDIYDLLHRTTLNGKVRQANVTEMNPAEIEEGNKLYLTGLRISLMCEKAVVQI